MFRSVRQKNYACKRKCPVAADAGGASAKSAQKSRKQSLTLNQDSRKTQIRTPQGRRSSACDLGVENTRGPSKAGVQAQQKQETVQERQDLKKHSVCMYTVFPWCSIDYCHPHCTGLHCQCIPASKFCVY